MVTQTVHNDVEGFYAPTSNSAMYNARPLLDMIKGPNV